MPRFRLTVAYDGTEFHGWQRQEPPGAPALRTVQGVLEHAVAVAVGSRVPVMGASRTDSGVHAFGQVAAFTADTRIPVDRLAMAINSRLPDDVRVRAAALVRDGFDPISDCRSKCYRYSMAFGDDGSDGALLFDRRTTWTTWHRLDVDRMRDAAGALVGTHDFAAFAQVNHGRETTVRTIHGCTVLAPRAGRAIVEVAGSGFLYNMVRIIAGTLSEAGRGRIDASHVRRALATGDRTVTGPTLPPHGLRLEWVRYGAGLDSPVPATDMPTDMPADAKDTEE
jgi:tRNA pseudouridine38-40 synthase